MAFKTVIAEMPVYYPGMPEYLGGERYIAQITVEDAGFTKYYPEDEPLKCFRFFLKAVGKTIPFVETCKINAKVFKKDVIPEATRILNELGLKTSTWKRVYKKASNPRRRKAKRNAPKTVTKEYKGWIISIAEDHGAHVWLIFKPKDKSVTEFGAARSPVTAEKLAKEAIDMYASMRR